MDEMVIQKHSFDVAKNRLKDFSEKMADELIIDRVQTEGGFLGLGDHKVTGEELNGRLEIIQKNFIAVNTTNNKVIREFREIYNALDVLDKDYIASIVANVKAIEKTSYDVRRQQETLKQHNEKLANQQSKLDMHQVEIEKNIANIAKIVDLLKGFMNRLEGYKHLDDIDKIWNDCRKLNQDMTELSSFISEAIEIGENNTKKINEMKHLIQVQDEQHSKCLDTQKKYIESIIPHVAETENTDLLLKKLNKKIQYTYWIAGGSMMLVLVEFFLLLLR